MVAQTASPCRVGERVVALALGLADEGEHDAGAGRVDKLDRPPLGHAQASRLGDPVYPGPAAPRSDGIATVLT
jgi:hypothetical protein